MASSHCFYNNHFICDAWPEFHSLFKSVAQFSNGISQDCHFHSVSTCCSPNNTFAHKTEWKKRIWKQVSQLKMFNLRVCIQILMTASVLLDLKTIPLIFSYMSVYITYRSHCIFRALWYELQFSFFHCVCSSYNIVNVKCYASETGLWVVTYTQLLWIN